MPEKDIEASKWNLFKLGQKEVKFIKGLENDCKEKTHPHLDLMSPQATEWVTN